MPVLAVTSSNSGGPVGSSFSLGPVLMATGALGVPELQATPISEARLAAMRLAITARHRSSRRVGEIMVPLRDQGMIAKSYHVARGITSGRSAARAVHDTTRSAGKLGMELVEQPFAIQAQPTRQLPTFFRIFRLIWT